MLNSIRNFSKTIFAKILLVIVVIPFVFWGMGGVFSSGNTNSLAKIDNINISTQEFIEHINDLNIIIYNKPLIFFLFKIIVSPSITKTFFEDICSVSEKELLQNKKVMNNLIKVCFSLFIHLIHFTTNFIVRNVKTF